MNRFGYEWVNLTANTVKPVRIFVVSDYPKAREE